MGSKGTLVVEEETTAMLWPSAGRATSATVTTTSAGQAAIDTSSTSGGPATAALERGQQSVGSGTAVSRGYREEMEDFAYCVKLWSQADSKDRRLPRCHGKVAMADAIIALTSNLAMKRHQRIEFQPSWFNPDSQDVPDAEMK